MLPKKQNKTKQKNPAKTKNSHNNLTNSWDHNF